MLYVSTRNKTESYTAYRTLHENYAPDGGMYVPFRLPTFTPEEINALISKPFSEIIAQILNVFFSCRLTSWDVEFCIGRYPYKLTVLNQKITVAELWHNTQNTYAHMVQCLYERHCTDLPSKKSPTQWFLIATEIAVLFGICGELYKKGIENFDVSLSDESFLHPLAVSYARRMGLSVNMIICACGESGYMWSFLHRGDVGAEKSTASDSVERMVYDVLGVDGVDSYLNTCKNHSIFSLPEETLASVNSGIFTSVVGAGRINYLINSLYRTNSYLADPETALSYGALQDYRALTGENQHTLLLSGCNPLLSADRLANAIGCTKEKLRTISGLCRE